MSLFACVLALAFSVVEGRALTAAASTIPERPGERVVTDALRTFNVVDVAGDRWTADHLRGRVLLLDFWATWCAPCLAELPRLKALREQYSRSDFEILGISLDAASSFTLRSWLNRHRIEWPQIHERAGYAGKLPEQFGVDRLPRTVLLDRNGRIAAFDLRGERLAEAVRSLVAEPAPTLEARR